MVHSPSLDHARRRLTWAGTIAAVFAALVVAVTGHGLSSRRGLEPAVEAGAVVAVADITKAFDFWGSAGIHGRHLVVLTGRWSRPVPPPMPANGVSHVQGGDPPTTGRVDVNGALFETARVGIARKLDVVMPPSAFSAKLGDVRGKKEFVRLGPSSFRLAYDGLERRFCAPDGFEPPSERVVVLVEPSWFDASTAADPLRWLSERGVTWDLAVIALADPVASRDQLEAAARVISEAGATLLEEEAGP